MRKNTKFDELYKILEFKLGADKARLAFAQILHETGGKANRLTALNNYSGIVYVRQDKRFGIVGAKDSGLKQPDGKFNYAQYDTLDSYVNDFLRIVNKSLKKSDTIKDYALNLKEQRYYGDTVQNYSKGLLHHYLKLKG